MRAFFESGLVLSLMSAPWCQSEIVEICSFAGNEWLLRERLQNARFLGTPGGSVYSLPKYG